MSNNFVLPPLDDEEDNNTTSSTHTSSSNNNENSFYINDDDNDDIEEFYSWDDDEDNDIEFTDDDDEDHTIDKDDLKSNHSDQIIDNEDNPLVGKSLSKKSKNKPTHDNADNNKENLKDNNKDNNSFSDKMKNRLNLFMKQVKSELHGKEYNGKDMEDEEENEDIDSLIDDEENGATKAKKKSKAPKIFKPIINFYNKIIDFIFKIITGILSILAKIPLLGRLFKFILKFTKVLKWIAKCLPLAIILIIIIIVNLNAVPSSFNNNKVNGNGSARFYSFHYDDKTKTASGKITNTGNINIKTRPVFDIYNMKPSLNPITWIIPQKVSECSGPVIRVNSKDTVDVKIECQDTNKIGFLPRISGKI